MALVKIGYLNVLENSTITVTSEATGYPFYRAYDRMISRNWKATGTSNQVIVIDQGATTQYKVNALIIPYGHRLDGTNLYLHHSTNGVTYVSSISNPFACTTAAIALDTSAALTKRYWRIRLYDNDIVPAAGEIFLTYLHTLTAQPLVGLRLGRKDNVQRAESASGSIQYVKKGEPRRVFDYELVVGTAEQATVTAWLDSWGGHKPFFVSDYAGNQYFAEFSGERPIPQYLPGGQWRLSVQVQEVL